MFKRIALLLLISFGIAFNVAADVSVSLDVSPPAGSVDDVFQINVTFSGRGTSQISQPQFEASDTFTVQPSGSHTGMQILNGTISQQTTFVFTLSPDPALKPGRYEIPQGYLKTGAEKVLLKRPSIEIVSRSSASREAAPSGVDFVQVVNNTEPYVGEQILYQAQIVTSGRLAEASLSDPQFPGFWHESFGQNSLVERRVQSTGAKIYAYQDALFPLKASSVVIPPRVLTGQVIVPRQQTRSELMDPFNSFIPDEMFGFGRYAKKRIVAPELTINVKPLPPRPDNGNSYIPVGKIRLRQSISSKDVKQGDSITFGYEFTGNANLRPLELPLQNILSKEQFKLYPDKPTVETSIKDGAIEQRKVFTYALVPLKSGTLEIPSFSILIFNPQKESYESLVTEAVTLTVNADPKYKAATTPAPAEDPSSSKAESAELSETPGQQRLGPDVAKSSFKLTEFNFWLLLLIPPALALPYIIRKLFRSAAKRESLAQQRNRSLTQAREKLLSLTAASEQTADELWLLLQTYLLTKFNLGKVSLTTPEALDILRSGNAPSDGIAAAEKLFVELDGARYGRPKPLSTNAIAAAKRIVEDLERDNK